MRAHPAVHLPTDVAVVAKNLIVRWESPTSRVLVVAVDAYLLPVFVTATVYVVQAQETDIRDATTGTETSIPLYNLFT